MKKFIILLSATVVLALNSQAQLKVGENQTTISANTTLEVESTSGSKVVVSEDSAKVGIGTNAPTNKLHVNAMSNPVRFEGIQSTSSISAQNLVVDSLGVIFTNQSNKVLTLATIKSADTTYLIKGAVWGSFIAAVHFDSVLLNYGNAYNELSGVFTAPWDGYYDMSVTLTTLPISGGPAAGSQARIGICVPNDTSFLAGNAAFAILNQTTTTSTGSNIPNIINASGLMYLLAGQKVIPGTRYIDDATSSINIEAKNYKRYYNSQFKVVFVGKQ